MFALALSATLLAPLYTSGAFARLDVAPAPVCGKVAGVGTRRESTNSILSQTEQKVDQVAVETNKLVVVTGILAVMTFLAVVVPLWYESIRRRDEAKAARTELSVSLGLYDDVIRKLCESPANSVAPDVEVLQFLFERVLAVDVATAVRPSKRSELYGAVAVAQLAIIEARTRQEQLKRYVDEFQSEQRRTQQVLAEGRRLSAEISVVQMKMLDVHSRAASEALTADLAELQRQRSVFYGTAEAMQARAFRLTESHRSAEIDAFAGEIRDKASQARLDVERARAALA